MSYQTKLPATSEIRFQWFDIRLSEDEIKDRRVEKTANDEQIQRAKDRLETAKQEIEADFDVLARKERNKGLMVELIERKRRVKVKCQEIVNEDDATVEYYAAEEGDGFASGDLVQVRDMTREEKFEYGIISQKSVRKLYND